MPLTELAFARDTDLETTMMYFKMCAIFGGERIIYKQGGIVLEADGHGFNVPWYGVGHHGSVQPWMMKSIWCPGAFVLAFPDCAWSLCVCFSGLCGISAVCLDLTQNLTSYLHTTKWSHCDTQILQRAVE